MQNGPDFWQICFFAVAAIVVALKTWHGWRLGVIRQSIGLVALASGYLTAIFGGRILAPVLFLLGVPSGLSTLVEDLHQRGLDEDVSVVVWGEFGRTPKINKDGGRDHWPQVGCALLAGGGMKTGQVIGSTNRLGETAKDRPVHFQEVFATLYHNLGIDLAATTVKDVSGRPHYLVDADMKPMRELV